MRKALMLGLGLLLAACATPAGEGEPSTSPSRPAETSAPSTQPISADGAWVLTEGIVDGNPVPIVDGYRITLTIEGRQLGGTAACNGYGATLSGDTGEVLVGEIGMTAMACQPPEVMASERTYTDGLTRVSRLALSGDMLELTGSGVSLSYVRLAAVPTGELLGTVWTLETLVQGDTASSVAGAPATLQLLPDGTVAGSTGCRELTGRYVVTGDEVLFTEFSAAGECPADLQTQDNHVVSVLGDGFTVAIEGDRLTMTSSGSDGLVYHSG